MSQKQAKKRRREQRAKTSSELPTEWEATPATTNYRSETSRNSSKPAA